ncbi:hypothetical protein CDV31_011722 [Fusarium ambrosium]|uniref:Uncharacterized protein n=1 Tax=Fusarium ambrosium TaxID=131363 RepID=A0A428TER5_9HYPO|nr:hypothetical protein CDV31_011722 [Fusarium ambrosium]
MVSLFGWGASAPEVVPGDKVLPLHFFDDTPVWRSFILYSLFVFEDVLDTDKIRHSLEELAQRDGWQKLGARLRRNSKGVLEYHIPTEFNQDRPSIVYNHVQHDTPIADDPIAGKIPKPSTRPSILGDPDQFLSLMHPEGSPKKLEDYVNSERPQLGLHTVSFKDATLVSIYWPHIMFDAMGKKALLTAWSLILQGRQDEILPLHGAGSDPLTELGCHPTEPHKLADRQLSTLGLVRYGLNHITEFALRGNETRIVCVPAAFMDKLREEAMRDFSVDSSSDEDTFLSEGDILCAWWTRIAISHLPQDSNTNVILYNAYSLRSVLSKDLLPAGTSYLSNATGFIHTPLTVKEINTKSLGYVASRIRQSISEYGTREQVEAFMSMVRQSQARTPPFFGDPSMHMVTYSNWSKAKMFETDFSAAIKPGSLSASEGHVPGRPTYIQNCQYGLTLPNAFPIMGKDAHGNYWLSGYLNKGNWDKINEILNNL